MTATSKRQIGIRIPKDLDRRLEEYVAKIGISKAAFILSVIYKELEAIDSHFKTNLKEEEGNGN